MTLLNLGCGYNFHSDWVNIDIVSTGPGVIAHDLSTGIPLADGVADAAYHSHVLEHLTREQGQQFMRECHRVLKARGILRVAVPDLEGICRAYLAALEKASSVLGEGRLADHEWMVLELVDQPSRERPGGDMADFAGNPDLINEGFILERTGAEGEELISAMRGRGTIRSFRRPFVERAARGIRRLSNSARASVLSKADRRALAVGRFRASGEVHRWMYDQVSLSVLMIESGFTLPRVVSARDSSIPGWESYSLDALGDGATRKPDSLFMEATKL